MTEVEREDTRRRGRRGIYGVLVSLRKIIRRGSPGDSGSEGTTKLGSLLKDKRRRSRSRDRHERSDSRRNGSSPVVPPDVHNELSNGDFDTSNISENAKRWLEERIAEQVLFFRLLLLEITNFR